MYISLEPTKERTTRGVARRSVAGSAGHARRRGVFRGGISRGFGCRFQPPHTRPDRSTMRPRPNTFIEVSTHALDADGLTYVYQCVN